MNIKNKKDSFEDSLVSSAEIKYLRGLTQKEPKSLKKYLAYLRPKKKQRIGQAIFVQSDGSVLRYAAPWDHGSQYPRSERQWFRTHAKYFEDYRLPKKKESQVKLGLWSSWMDKSNLILIAADFDSLPSGYNSFDDFGCCLEDLYGTDGIVLRTLSKKCKVLFQIEIKKIRSDHTIVARDALKYILERSLFECCDLKKSSLSIVFLTPENTRLIQSRIDKLKPIFRETDGPINSGNFTYNDSHKVAEGVDIVCKIEQQTPLRKYNGPIKGALAVYVGNRMEGFLRALLGNRALITGVEICQSYFASQLGLKQYQISRFIKTLHDDKNLVRLKGGYKVGHRSIKYRAIGALRDLIKKIPKNEYERMTLPTSISDGKWNWKLFRIAVEHFNRDPKGFIIWAKGLPNAHKKDRLKKIEYIYQKLKTGSIR